MKRLCGVLFFSLVCLTSTAKCKEAHIVFTYEFSGGLPGSTHYMFRVSDDGTFSVETEGLPITDEGVTKQHFSTKITKDEVRKIVELAINARDFVNNPADPLADCSSAEMMVVNGREKIMRRSGCIDEKWDQQPQTKLLLAEIARHLPKDMRDLP